MIRRALVALVGVAALLGGPAAPAVPAAGAGVNVTHVANIRWGSGRSAPVGTDLELVTIDGRDYAFAGTYRGGLQVVDITNPRRPEKVASYGCGVVQGDVQILRQGGRIFVTYTSDDGYGGVARQTQCFRDAGVQAPAGYGTFFIDVTNPRKPVAVSFIGISRGSHNVTVHPSGKFLYNSNADLSASLGVVEVVDVSRIERPTVSKVLDLATGLSGHDITFSADGTRAYVAAITHTLVLDTSDPAAPTVLGRIVDPAINIHHQSDPVTLVDPVLGPRTFVIVTDELAGAGGNAFCPGGGLHVYEVTGPLERAPLKVGFFAIPELHLTDGDSIVCTSHVLKVYPERMLMTIGWYAAGVRVLDLSGLVGASVGVAPELGSLGAGLREIGWFRFPSSDTWAVKTNRIAADGSFFMFANDVARGFDVYRFIPPKTAAGLPAPGTWLEPTQLPRAVPPATAGDYRPTCLVIRPAA